MAAQRPNVLVIMTDEERYPPPYEDAATRRFRADQLVARNRLKEASVELHRHYVAATACTPSRASLFTGHYPSLHGVSATDGIAKSAHDPDMAWLDPDEVPTMGDWFRAAGYQTHYRGKWHVSHADLPIAGHHRGLSTNDATGVVLSSALEAYRATNRLDPFGFSGWIGREPHGADPADSGYVRDPLYGQEVADLFSHLESHRGDAPFLAVASLVNPHDIAFTGGAWAAFGFPPPDDTVPEVPAPPSGADSFDERPTAQRQFHQIWHQAVYPQATDLAYRQLYFWLHKLVDRVIERILDALAASSFAHNTVVVFTSDHGDLLGAHGGMVQKWHNAFDEAIRVPFWVSGPGIEPGGPGIEVPTSHADVLPTVLGLVGLRAEELAATVATTHIETHLPVGRDLSPLLRREVPAAEYHAPVYFMTEDQITKGARQRNLLTHEAFPSVAEPANVESVIATLAAPSGGSSELWKLSRYYQRPEPRSPGSRPAEAGDAESVPEEWELYNLSADPEERQNLVGHNSPALASLRALLAAERRTKALEPQHQNPG